MKKLFITSTLFLSACTMIMAQDAATDLKPAAGANNLELNFTPLGSKPIQMTYVRYRRFLSDKTAFRLGVGISYSSSKADSVRASNAPGAVAGSTVSEKYKMSSFGWNIKPGFEKHFEGTNRLSPYIGAELDLAGMSSKEVTPISNDAADEWTIQTDKNKNKGGFFRLGVNLVAGFDCYITKHIYLGTELGFGFQTVMYSDHKQTTEYSTLALPAGYEDPKPVDQGSEMNIGPNFNSAIRLGWIF
jgi:hypothetical protein